MEENPYRRLAARLDALPEGFPATEKGLELRLLEHLFTPEEADLVSQLRLTPETPTQLAARLSGDPRELNQKLKSLVRRGLIAFARTPSGIGYHLLPFVVGIYELQGNVIDKELAELFEAYYQKAFHQVAQLQPSFHRVVPIKESIRSDMEILPYENAHDIVTQAQAWGVSDCVCRKQQALIGHACEHPIDVCMFLSPIPGAFDYSPTVKAVTREEALATLQRAAEAGLVHSVSNSRDGLLYICNCCTCGCGILRGIAKARVANVIARSPYVCEVDAEQCIGCGVCVPRCPAEALSEAQPVRIDADRCIGCGVCTLACPTESLHLIPRPDMPAQPLSASLDEWRTNRAQTRGIDIEEIR